MFLLSPSANYLPWIAIFVAIAIGVLLAGGLCFSRTYHKKNKTGQYLLTKMKRGTSNSGQVAQANGHSV